MIFGIGEGKVDLVLDKMNYSYGETIKGKVKLDMPKPAKAKELRVELFAIKTVQETQRSSKGGTRSVTRDRVLYTFKLSLGGEQEYSTKEYDFEIRLPPAPVQGAAPAPGWVSDALNVLSMFGMNYPIKWHVNVSLDRSMGFDTSKKVQITVQ